MNIENSKTSEPHRFKLDLTGTLNLKNPKKNIALANLSICYTWKNIKSEYSNNEFKVSAPTLTENPPVQVYQNKIKNRTVFKIKGRYKLELLTPETMRLLGSTKKDVDKDKNGEIVPKLESVEVVLVHCNLVKNDYQHTSKVLFSFVPNKPYQQLINILPHSWTQNILLLKFDLQIKLVKHLKLKIMSIWY